MGIRLLLSNAAIDSISPKLSNLKQGIFDASACPPFSDSRVTWASSGCALPFSIEPYDQKLNFKPFYWNALIPYVVISSTSVELCPQCQCRLSRSVRMGAGHTWGMQLMYCEIAQQMQMWTTYRLCGHLAKPSRLVKNHWLSTESSRLSLYC